MKGSIYATAFLLRKTGMPLGEIRKLSPGQFKDLLEEIEYQEAVADYQTGYYIASLMATIANTVPRKGGRTYKSADFLGRKEPRRVNADGTPQDPMEELTALAAKFKIKLPGREIRDL